jgi:hypothetical protein
MGLHFSGSADGRGFGGFRGGSFGGFEGFRGGSYGGFSGYRSGSFGGYDRSFDYSGSRSGSLYSGAYGGWGGTGSYDRSWTGSRGGSIDVDGSRGFGVGPYGGFAAGGQRDVTATGPGGRTYSSDTERGIAAGPYGRYIGGGERSATATGPRGSVSSGWQSAFAGNRFSTDFGLSHYSTFNAAGVGHSTAYWSHGYVTTRAGYVRSNFGYYNAFRPAWYTAHPGCWYAAGWAAGAAWASATWSALASFCAIPAAPVDYDIGNTNVYQNNHVYDNGQDVGSAPQYAQQAFTLADQGQQAKATPEQDWKALGVFALVQGEEKSSNNLFQLAINKDGIIRGNFYDGLIDATSPVYGSVDRKTQRAAWTIDKKSSRVFETGLYNLTKAELPVLVHIGTDRTEQMLLVRMEQPKDAH